MGYKASIRDKLIGVFVLIKVIPLIILAWFVWNEISSLSVTLETHVNEMAKTSSQTTKQVANLAISSSIRTLDIRSREAIEHLTTDTARNVAAFLESRDVDIRMASLLKPDKDLYQMFLTAHKRNITLHRPWVMNENKTAWQPRYSDQGEYPLVSARNIDNELDFHYRDPSKTGVIQSIPIYLEMTYVDISGKEIIKSPLQIFCPLTLKMFQKEIRPFAGQRLILTN